MVAGTHTSPWFYACVWLCLLIAPHALAEPCQQPEAPASIQGLAPAEAQALAAHALSRELDATQDKSHPMRYRLRKVSPRLETVKEIYETRDGGVARLLQINGSRISAEDEQKELARLDALSADASKQRHRYDNERQDEQHAQAVLNALPKAFRYTYSGLDRGPSGSCTRLDFTPDPAYQPQELETKMLAAMNGQICIDTAQNRVTWLEGHVMRDVDFGWGILGRLRKGGWIRIEQAEVSPHLWRTVHLKLVMSGRIFFHTVQFDTMEDQSDYAPLPPGLDYRQAIQMLCANN